MDIPLIHKFATGYAEGAKSVNPNIRVIDNYVGINDAAWNNPGKGKELAIAQIGKGADVIFTAAGNSGLGAFDAAEQYGKLVIGVDANQNWVKPGYVLTSMVKRVDTAVYQTIKDRVENAFKGGVHVYGLENDGVAYALDSDALARFRARLAQEFAAHLTAQDRQGWRPHVTVQNKVSPDTARALHADLSAGFAPFRFTAPGTLLWRYRGGPWDAVARLPFGENT